MDGDIEHKFITQSDGTTTAKTPMDCFKDFHIDNDLQFVIEQIDKYNEGLMLRAVTITFDIETETGDVTNVKTQGRRRSEKKNYNNS